MRAVIQVKSAIGPGLLILLGIGHEDGQEDMDWLVKKIAGLRIFNDDAGVMNRSVVDVGGEALVVSQFTLMASTKKGNQIRKKYLPWAIFWHKHAISLPATNQANHVRNNHLRRPICRSNRHSGQLFFLFLKEILYICIQKNKS